MLRKKRVLAIVGVACILVASLSIVYVAASPAWTIDDMVSWMEKVGKPKIWKILRNTNQMVPKLEEIRQVEEVIYDSTQWTWYLSGNSHGWGNIGEALDDIKDELGQGLVGETEQGNLETVVGGGIWLPFVSFSFPDNPKKVSLWIKLRDMKEGDKIRFSVVYDVDGDGMYELPLDTKTRQFTWEFVWPLETHAAAVPIVDELPVTTRLRVDYYQDTGESFTLFWQTIVEEM